MLAARALVLVFFAALVGCGASTSSAPTPTTTEGNAPYPYTSAEIRDGCPTGRWRTYAVSGPASGFERMTFVASSAEGAVVESVAVDESGAPIGEPARQTATWDELHEHAAFPASRTTIRDEVITVPAGTFACRLYVVEEPDTGAGPRTSRYWFATDVSFAGPPIRMEVVSGAETMMSMALVAWGD